MKDFLALICKLLLFIFTVHKYVCEVLEDKRCCMPFISALKVCVAVKERLLLKEHSVPMAAAEYISLSFSV